MNCREFQSRMQETFRLPEAAASGLQQHGEQCDQSECREIWTEFILLDEAIHHWRRNHSSTSFERHAVPGDVRHPWSRNRHSRLRAGLVLGMACFAVALLQHRSFFLSPKNLSQQPGAEMEMANGPKIADPSFIHSARIRSLDPQTALLVDWIAGTPLQVSGSMASLLLGPHETSPAASSESDVSWWRNGWTKQLIPTAEDMELLRGLLWERNDQRSESIPDQSAGKLS